MKRQLLDKILICLLGMICLFLVVITIIGIYPFRVAEFENPLEVKNVDRTVKAGELLLFNRNSQKFINLPATVSCAFEDDIIYNIPTRISNLPVGDYDSTTSVVVPANLPPSDYQYTCTMVYTIFGFKEVTVYMYTEFFTVL